MISNHSDAKDMHDKKDANKDTIEDLDSKDTHKNKISANQSIHSYFKLQKSKSNDYDSESTKLPTIALINEALKREQIPLKNIPFTRVVGVQKKRETSFSPFLNFSDLVANLTKSLKTVRMIPVGGVTSKEAEYIRNEINKRKRTELEEDITRTFEEKHKRHS